MIIDDSPLLCNILRDSLADPHTEVTIACTGSEGLNIATTNSFDLILLDIILPDIDGYTVCASLKNQEKTANIPVIFITSSNKEADILAGFEVGAMDYICKPFSNYELRARVFTHLKNKLMTDQLRIANEELAKALEQNRILAMNDPLTKLFNRRYISQCTDKLFENVLDGEECSILIGDIDDFKQINDTYGHCTGDYILASISDILKKTLPKFSVIGRWGGEEFIILLLGIGISEAAQLGERLCKTIFAYNFVFNKQHLKCSITIGCSELSPDLGVDKSISEADKLMYEGKNSGKNKCVSVSKAK